MAVSASTRDALRDFGITDVTVVPEGIEPPPLVELPAKEQRPTIVWCARHVPYKRPLDLIDAASRLQASIPDLQVWMIGGGPLLEQVRAAAPAGIEVFGRVSEEEKLDRMARAHVHVATSLREGWGLVVSEAAALGTPTVAYDVPGLRDSTLAAGGVVVPPTPDALVAWLPSALETWMADPIEPIPYGGAHSWEFVAQQVLYVALTKSDLARTFGPPLTVVRDAA
jgi:glycosyltransferase involved in cell wall biosynthesis